ncbi:MAG: lamin tail domain-containing protein [Actinomycetota bacterium]
MSRQLRTALAVLVLVAAACSEPSPEREPVDASTGADATVARVIDGDSVELLLDGQDVEARLIGINAPELADCQGPAAGDALASVVDGQAVEVIEFGTDRFGRLLVELIIADESVNEALVRAGWALGLHGDERDWTVEMRAAADSGLGMWDLPDICAPSDAGLVIAGVQENPPGPDDDVLEDEWVEIENAGSEVVDLAGWTLRDESTSNRFTFESGALAPGDRLRLRTGCGEDTATDVHWCSPAGVWSNRGETVLLLAPSGAIADYRFL